jgi:ribonuclease P protein component
LSEGPSSSQPAPIPKTREASGPPHEPDQRFTRAARILRGSDFQRIYARRSSASDDVLLVYACENGREGPRLGLSVSRKVGGAVIRNHWKRLLREAFRLSKSDLPRGVDLVVIPRQSDPPDLARLIRSLGSQARRAVNRLQKAAR